MLKRKGRITKRSEDYFLNELDNSVHIVRCFTIIGTEFREYDKLWTLEIATSDKIGICDFRLRQGILDIPMYKDFNSNVLSDFKHIIGVNI